MKFLVKLGALSVAAVVLSAGLALAQDNTPEPSAEPGMGGLTEVEEPIIDGGSYGGGHGDSTEAGPGNGDSGDSDSDDAGSDNGDSASFTPLPNMYCQFYAGNHTFPAGAYLTNTGNVTIPAGSIVRFSLVGGRVLEMTVPFDVVPGGQWAWYVGGDPYYSFPAGIRIPRQGFCDAELILA